MKKLSYILLFILTWQINAQQKELSLKDAVLGYYKGLYPKTLRNLQWLKRTDAYMYNDGGKIIIKNAVDQSAKTITLADLSKQIKGLKYMPYIETATDQHLIFDKDHAKILYDYNTGQVAKITYPENAENLDYNFVNKHLAYTIDNNLYLANLDSQQIPVAVNDNKNIVSGQAIARSEFGITKGTFWSPNADKLAFYQKDETKVDDYPLVDITVTPAKLHNIKYPMNGRGSEEPAVGVYDLSSKKTIYLKLFKGAGKEHYVTNLTWQPNGHNEEQYIYLAEVNRDQNHMWFNQYDVRTGNFVKTLFEETNDKWVEPEHPAFFIPNTKNQFIWLSERDGFMNLYKYNTDGKLLKQLTHNKWVTNDILGFSKDGKYVYIIGTGKDPRDQKLFKVHTRTGKMTTLTPKSGQHYIMMNDDKTLYLDNFSNVDTPRIIYLQDVDCKLNTALLKADNPVKDYKVNPKPEMFSITGEYGDKIYARLFKPADFDPNKKYPVLVYVYGGPHAQMNTNRWMGGAPLWMPWLASQGYLVFTVDGHGSDNRGFAFESVIHRHLGRVEMKDQLHGVDYLKSLPYVDAKRLAVHGWSFGGFMTSSLMTTYPEVFTTGVAGGPVTDWKWYEVMYGERYMDRYQENPEGFKETSVLNKIQNLKGHLLTIHGYQDDVVVPQHNIALHREAIKKGIQMDFYLYPTAKHNVRGIDRVHLMTKVLNYIMQYNK